MSGNLQKGLQDTQLQADLLDASLRKVGMVAGGVFSVQQATQFVQTMVKVRSELQNLSTSFEVLIGNSAQAESLFKGIADYAVNTPMLLGDLAKGAQTLLSFNMEAERVLPTLKQLGDISMGNTERFNSLTLAFAQCQSTGRLMGQDLLQMINAGFNPLAVIASTTGKTIGQLKDEMAARAISAQQVADAFEAATAEGGKYHQMLDKMSKNTAGLISNFEGAVQEMYNQIGASQEGVVNGAIEMGITLVKNYEEVGKALGALVIAYGAYKAAVIASIAVSKAQALAENIKLVMMMRKELGLATAAQQAFNLSCAANPYIALGMGIVALTSIVWMYSKANTAAADEQERINNLQKEQADEIDTLRQKVDEYLKVLQDEVATEGDRKTALEELQRLMPSVFGKYRTEIDLVRNLTNAYRESNAELERRNMLNGAKNYIDGAQSLSELRKLREYSRKFNGESYASISNKFGRQGLSEYADYKRLRQKYDPQIRQSQGTLQSYNGALDDLIAARTKGIGGLAEVARTDAHKAFFGKLSGMTKDALGKEEQHLRSLLGQLSNSGKGWIVVNNEVAPINKAGIEARLKAVVARKTTIANDASRDYLADATSRQRAAEKKEKEILANRNNRSLYPTEADYRTALHKAREDREAADKEVKELGGATTRSKKRSSGKTSGLTPQEKKNIAAADKADKEERIAAAKKAQEAAEKKAELELREAALSREKEGSEKQRKVNQLEYDKTEEQIRQRKLSWIAELQQLSDMEFEAANPNWEKKGLQKPKVTEDDLSPDQQRLLKELSHQAQLDKAQADAQIYKPLIEGYRDYEEQRKAIHEQFAKDRADAEQAVDANGTKLSEDRLASILAEIDKKEQAALKQVNDAELDELTKYNTLLISLFEDSSQKSILEVQAIIDKVRLLMDYLKAAKNEQGDAVITDQGGNVKGTITQSELSKLGFSPTFLKTLSDSPEKIKALSDALKGLTDRVRQQNPFKEFTDKLQEGLKKLKQGSWKEGLSTISQAAVEFAPVANQAADALSQIFDSGSEEGGGLADSLHTAIGVVSNLGKTAEGILSGNPMAILEGVGGLFAMANEAAERHRKALQAIMADQIAQQRAYNLLLLDQNLAYERGATIFGTDAYAKAQNALVVMRQAHIDLRKAIDGTVEQQAKFLRKSTGQKWLDKLFDIDYDPQKAIHAGLASIKVVTGHERTGVFGWGKGRDVYSSVLSVYPQLLKANGELDVSLAKTILSTRRLDDESKAALQNILDLADKEKEAWDSVKGYFGDLFGDLGNVLSDGLRNAFRMGSIAAKDFADSVEKMLSKLAEQMIYSATIAPLLEKAQEQMLAITKDQDKTDVQKFASYTDIISMLMDDVMAQKAQADGLWHKVDEIAKAKGYDLTKAEGVNQRGQSAALQAVTQDSIVRVEGLINALLIHSIQTEGQVDNIANQMSTMLQYLRKIEQNTAMSAEVLGVVKSIVEGMRDDISTIRRDGIKTL